MNLDNFIENLQSKTGKNAKQGSNGYTACCPAHDDTHSSLSIAEGNDGKILINCFAGCSIENICDSLGISVSDLFTEFQNSEERLTSKRTTYPYQNEEGNTLFSKIRIEPGFNGNTKSFYWERLDETGRIVKNLNDCRKVLYRLPALLKAISKDKTIFLVEGEKDAEKLIEYGLQATTSPESLKWTQEFSDTLRNANVAILYDMDKTGLERKELLCKNLYGKVKRLRIIDLPGLEYQDSHGKDVSDWLSEGHTTAEMLEFLANTPDFIPTQKGKIKAITIDEFLKLDLPKQEMILSPFLPTQGLCLIYAKRGVGKTHVALGIAYATASGGTFLKWEAPKPRKVLYLDGEMPAIAMQERLRRISVTENIKPPTPDYLRFITPDLQDGPMPDLSTKDGRNAIEELIIDRDLIIIDNISTLFRSGTENEAESWQPVQDWALEMRRQGKSILFIHHAAKGGQQRGTSKKEDILDTVISLKQPPNYQTDEGACFEVNFEKIRHFAGEEAESFQVNLREQDDGLWIWEICELDIDPKIVEIAEAHKQGLTIMQIMKQTGLTKSQIETKLKKAKQQGLI